MRSPGKAYFRGTIAEELPIEMETLRKVFKLHVQGSLVEAFEVGQSIDPYSIKDKKLRVIFVADHVLLAVKIGRGWLEDSTALAQEDIDGRCILEYARYSYHFWNDHNAAWRSIWRLLMLAPRSSCPSLITTVLFLVGHMLCIAGRQRTGFAVATAAYSFFMRHKRGTPSSFASNIVFAAYPYTLFVSAKIQGLEKIIQPIIKKLPNDPYYQNIFQVSCLYAHAYSGYIAQTELYAHSFQRLYEQERLLRYVPVTRIMPLLPLALRGYSDLVRQSFDDVLSKHDADSTDIVINSQFYRAASLISLCLGNKDQALDLIKKAADYRKQSNSFQSWLMVDNRIELEARDSKPFDPSVDQIIQLPTVGVPPQLATAFMKIITTSPTGIVDPLEFRNQVVAILSQHFECEGKLVKDTTDPRLPALKLGDEFLVFDRLPEFRIDTIWSMINVIAPSIKVLEINVSNTRAMIDRLGEAEKQAAIAKMTQMLAHDVRKPFSILKMGIGILSSAKDPEGVKKVLGRLLPEIDKAVGSVDGLISDVMEVGSTSTQLIREPASPLSLIESALIETFRVYPKARVAIAYDFGHMQMVNVHVQKVGRAFSNIIGNAVQAMGPHGAIWFKTRQQDGLVEFCIGNSGSVIPTEHLSKLFDTFFTSGKKGGTGLGLAIAQKVIISHGGKIWCESSTTSEHPRGKVEFYFTLPVAEGHRCRTSANLPLHSSEITTAFQSFDSALHAGDCSIENSHLNLKAASPSLPSVSQRKPEVLIVEDNPFMLEAWVEVLGSDVTVYRLSSFEEISARLEADPAFIRNLDYVVTDMHFEKSGGDGLDVARLLKKHRPDLQILLSTDDPIPKEDLIGIIDLAIGKTPITFADMIRLPIA